MPGPYDVQVGEAKMLPAGSAQLRETITTDPRYKPWFDEFTRLYDGEPNLNDPDYDYRAAVAAGVTPQPYTDAEGKTTYHWASSTGDGQMLKGENHPTLWMTHFMDQTGIDPATLGLKSEGEGSAWLRDHEGNMDWKANIGEAEMRAPNQADIGEGYMSPNQPMGQVDLGGGNQQADFMSLIRSLLGLDGGSGGDLSGLFGGDDGGQQEAPGRAFTEVELRK